MDPKVHAPTQHGKSTSLYGYDLTNYIDREFAEPRSAFDVAQRALTHGGIYPREQAFSALNHYDRAALDTIEAHPELQTTQHASGAAFELVLYVNTLGRLHIRPATDERVVYDENDRVSELGYVAITEAVAADIAARHERLLQIEAQAFVEVEAALERLIEEGRLDEVLGEVIDHIEHVESVCFYLGDRFFALIDRYVNLIDDKRGRGFLSLLRDKPFEQWSADERLAVAAGHALFTSGRSVRFEEFNGALLSAHGLLTRLDELAQSYSDAGNEVSVDRSLGLFERAHLIRQQTLHATGKPWLRYRWIYGLNFRKIERILPSTESSEAADAWWREFAADYRTLVGETAPPQAGEHAGMMQLAAAAVARDAAGVPCKLGSTAVTGWVEYLMERIVGSAVEAVNADYGMSSSIRDMSQLVTYDDDTLIQRIHALTPANFFTCFVSKNLIARTGADEAKVIASSVQKRMQFNRWHFIPGNLEREVIASSRHWYYPPLVPDIAVHSDVHRAAHTRARVKYSIRSPGPDMSRPALNVAGRPYRGFYDVRVVRMNGDEFTTDDIVRVRRRTLWLESLYAALSQYLMSPGAKSLPVKGFEAGTYHDIALPDDVVRQLDHALSLAGRQSELDAPARD